MKKIQITARDGSGSWGGRVRTMKIIGSKRTVTITGGAFKSAFGLRSSLFTLGGSTSVPKTPASAVLPGATYAAFPRTYDTARGPELLIITAGGTLVRYPVSASGLGVGRVLGAAFDYTNIVNAGDWNGDRYQDVAVRSGKVMSLLRENSSGALGAGVTMGATASYRALTGVGDLNGDKRPDLVALTTADNLWLLPGNGATGRAKSIKLAGGWKRQDLVRGIGDLTGDKVGDIVARSGDRLYLYAGTKKGIKAGSCWGPAGASTPRSPRSVTSTATGGPI